MKATNSHDLCSTFLELGDRVSCNLQDAWSSGLLFGEETITETLLLELRRRNPHHVHIQSFTKYREARNGADWEWWFIDKSGTFGFQARVQAKRLVKSSLNFRGLLTYRPRNGPATQIDLLIDRSKASGAVPLHCFYVVDSYLEQLGKSGANDSDIGCLFAHSQLVKRGGQIKLHAIEKIAFPWHRLVCPKADDPQMSLPHRVCEAVLNASKKTEDALSKPEAKVDFFVPPVCERLPNYVTRTLDPEAYKGARRSLAVDLARERNIRGLVLIIDNAETPEMGRPET